MKELLLPIENWKTAKYQNLADGIRSAIRGGKIKPGEKLPSSRDMARRLKMHRHTVMNALGELVSEGWVESVEKKYYQVVKTLPSTFLQAKFVSEKPNLLKQRKYSFARKVDIPRYISFSNCKYSFPSGFPDIRLFPMQEFKSHMYDAIRSSKILSYGDPAGHPKLISEVETYLRRVRSVEGKEIIITNGSQEAIFLLAQTLIRPGDYVAVEALGYPPALEALKFAGAKLLPIAIDQEGLVVSELEKQLKNKNVKLLYLTPLHQYPTTVSLSASRRLQLYELACKYNILIIEDDYDHEFHYVSQPIAPLASFDPAGIILYVSTFSKVLFPSSRVGFMAVPSAIREEVAKLKRISSRQNEQIMQDTIARWMEAGGFEKHLRKMRRTYEERRNSILTDLSKHQKNHSKISWVAPDGGMALWLNLLVDSKKIAERALQKGILIHPEVNYRLDKNIGTHIRLGYSGQTTEENRDGLAALFSLI